jgi:predicted small metal-binding protein
LASWHEEADVNQVTCECGYYVRDNDEDHVVELVLQHVSAAHPELVETVTPAVVRGWIEIVP